MRSSTTDLAIIGAGPAGLAAALEARRRGVERVLVLERDERLGGILPQCIHVGFGLHYFDEDLTGCEYAQRFIDDVTGTDVAQRLRCMVLEITPERTIYASSRARGLERTEAEAIVLAMGCRERTRGALRIPGTRPAGIYAAGTAQRLVNIEGIIPGTRFVIVGSGDIGLIMARRLTLSGATVEAVVEIMPFPGGLMRNVVQCLHDFDIPLYLQHAVTRIDGRSRVEGVSIAPLDGAGQTLASGAKRIPCDTVLVSAGLIPENELSKTAGVRLDQVTGGALVDDSMETSVPGIFAAGDVVYPHDLVDWVSTEAETAARAAAGVVREGVPAERQWWDVAAGEGARMVVPQRIRANGDAEVALSVRPERPMQNAVLSLQGADGRLIVERRRRAVWPAEVETLTVDRGALRAGERLSVSIGGQ
ncbi:MAG: FAD-dependent oxidoreductase [Armatimonadota bacterium]|jgi:NADPH-dependent 2,4-dienoyl-CoA reductase/sulfur reductase-like enzyme